MVNTYTVDGVKYTSSNKRMRYDPEYHENYYVKFTEDDLIYLCSMYDNTTKANIAAALGKTPNAILGKAHTLRKRGLFEHYKNLGQREAIT